MIKFFKMKRKNYWTKEVCKEEASKYLSKSDFMCGD